MRDKARGVTLVLPYNPEKVDQSKSSTYRDVPRGEKGPPKQWTGGGTRTLSLSVMLDARDHKPGVWATVEQLFSWLEPTKASVQRKMPAGPVLELAWGKQTWYEVHLTSVSTSYTMFDPDGTPIRATAALSFERIEKKLPKQNPTSGSQSAQRALTLVAGDTLQSLAWVEYRDPNRWRDLARVNGIDDPLAVRPGQRVLVPSIVELEARHDG